MKRVMMVTAILGLLLSVSALGHAEYAFVRYIGSPGSADGQFSDPHCMSVDVSGNLWVVDSHNHRLQQFTSDGTWLKTVGSAGDADGQLRTPRGLGIDPLGNIWVLDKGNYRVQKFDSDGNYLMQFGSGGTGIGQFHSPCELAIDSSGNIFVTDYHLNRVQKFDGNGNYLMEFNGSDSTEGQLRDPYGIAVDPSDNVWVSDASYDCIFKFTNDGAFIFKFGGHGSVFGLESPAHGLFSGIAGLDADPWGTIWASEQGNDRVQRADDNGNFLETVGPYGACYNSQPVDVVADAFGNLYIADVQYNRIIQYRIPEPATITLIALGALALIGRRSGGARQ